MTVSKVTRVRSYCDFAKIDFGGARNVVSGLPLPGGKTAFIGKAGNDCWGRLYEENLKTKGVTTRIFYDDKLFTGLALVGARYIITHDNQIHSKPSLCEHAQGTPF